MLFGTLKAVRQTLMNGMSSIIERVLIGIMISDCHWQIVQTVRFMMATTLCALKLTAYIQKIHTLNSMRGSDLV